MLRNTARWITKWLRNTSIRSRLIIAYSLLLLLPIIVILGITYSEYSQTLVSKTEASVYEIVGHVQDTLKRELTTISSGTIDLIYNDDFQKGIKSHMEESHGQKTPSVNPLTPLIVTKYALDSAVSDVLILSADGERCYDYTTVDNKLRIVPEVIGKIMEKAQKSRAVAVWGALHKGEYSRVNAGGFPVKPEEDICQVYCCRQIRDLYTGALLGYIIVGLDSEFLSNVILGGKDDNIFSLSMLDDRGNIPLDDRRIQPLDDDLLSEIFNEYSAVGETISLFANGDMIIAQPIINTQFFLMCKVPESFLYKEVRALGLLISVSAIVSICITAILFVLISRTITTPLNNLVQKMEYIKHGDFSVSAGDSSRDEVGILARNFDTMASQLQTLFSQVKEKERQRANAEMEALQAQINPHFLSNTLNTVAWLAKIQGADNIADVVGCLISLMRKSMRKDSDYIEVGQELECVRDYITIQQYKQTVPINISFDVDRHLMQTRIPKFICITLVENSVIHGITDRTDTLDIIIKICEMPDGRMKILVNDNGKGIAEERLDQIHENWKQNVYFPGIGLENIRNRLMLDYGDRAQMHISSKEDMFTSVEIQLPVGCE